MDRDIEQPYEQHRNDETKLDRDELRDVIFGLLTDWLPYADKYDEQLIQARTDRMLIEILRVVDSC